MLRVVRLSQFSRCNVYGIFGFHSKLYVLTNRPYFKSSRIQVDKHLSTTRPRLRSVKQEVHKENTKEQKKAEKFKSLALTESQSVKLDIDNNHEISSNLTNVDSSNVVSEFKNSSSNVEYNNSKTASGRWSTTKLKNRIGKMTTPEPQITQNTQDINEMGTLNNNGESLRRKSSVLMDQKIKERLQRQVSILQKPSSQVTIEQPVVESLSSEEKAFPDFFQDVDVKPRSSSSLRNRVRQNILIQPRDFSLNFAPSTETLGSTEDKPQLPTVIESTKTELQLSTEQSITEQPQSVIASIKTQQPQESTKTEQPQLSVIESTKTQQPQESAIESKTEQPQESAIQFTETERLESLPKEPESSYQPQTYQKKKSPKYNQNQTDPVNQEFVDIPEELLPYPLIAAQYKQAREEILKWTQHLQ